MTAYSIARYFVVGLLLVGPLRIASANLVTNGDFETGDFTGWTVTNAASGSIVVVGVGPGPDVTFGAFFAAIGSDFDSISQTLPTTPGAFYHLSFFYQPDSPSSPPDNGFRVLFNGNVVFENLDSISGFGTFTFNHLPATGASTTLEFQGRNPPTFDFLDNVSVNPSVPDTCSSVLLLGFALMALQFIRSRRFGSELE